MSLIQIFSEDGIQIDFVKETLTIRKENNSFSSDFKIAASAYPFLIIENANSLKALGNRDITSINKPKITQVKITEGNNQFQGELQVLSYLKGFRKCNLKYATKLLSIMDKKIAEFMPVVSVIPGETDPIPYTDEAPYVFYGGVDWAFYPVDFWNKDFPDVRWQFPVMSWPNKYGIDLSADDPWYEYKNLINAHMIEEDTDLFMLNSGTYEDGVIKVENRNIASPQVYLLSPLYYAMESLGYKVTGSFTLDNFIRKLLFLSTNDNMTKTVVGPIAETVSLDGLSWENYFGFGWLKLKYVELEFEGTYTLKYDFVFPDSNLNPIAKLFIKPPGQDFMSCFSKKLAANNGHGYHITGEITFNNPASGIGANLQIFYGHQLQLMPESYSLNLGVEGKEYYLMHPTIELGRYLPDWTFPTYLNEMKKEFNLDIDIDDFKKEISLNFNETYIETSPTYIINKSLGFDSSDQALFDSFLLKYGNDEDPAIWVTVDGSQLYLAQNSDFLTTIESKFKLVKTNNYTAALSEDVENKEGVGLMIYDSENSPYISDNFNGQTLNMSGDRGIYDIYWKNWLKFRLNASPVEITGPFTEIEIAKILDHKIIYIDRQQYAIVTVEISEAGDGIYQLKMNLESINY